MRRYSPTAAWTSRPAARHRHQTGHSGRRRRPTNSEAIAVVKGILEQGIGHSIIVQCAGHCSFPGQAASTDVALPDNGKMPQAWGLAIATMLSCDMLWALARLHISLCQ